MAKKILLSDGYRNHEKSKTQPGMAYSATELLRRSQNGTMPSIYQEGMAYDFDDFVNGKQQTFADQELYDVEPIPAYPSLEDIFEMREQAKATLNNVNRLIKKHLEDEKKLGESTPSDDPAAVKS